MISNSEQIFKIQLPSQPLIHRKDHTPTEDHVSLHKPLSCVRVPPVMDDSNHVSFVVPKMDLRYAQLITKMKGRSVSMLRLPIEMIPMRLECVSRELSLLFLVHLDVHKLTLIAPLQTPMRTKPTNTMTISKYINPSLTIMAMFVLKMRSYVC